MGLPESKPVNEPTTTINGSDYTVSGITSKIDQALSGHTDGSINKTSVYCDLCFPQAFLVKAVKLCDFCNRYLCRMCHVSHRHAPMQNGGISSTSNCQFISSERLEEIKPRGDFDKTKCWVSGMTVLHTGELLVADGSNCNIKLMRAYDWSIISKLDLKSEPFDIVVISKYEAAVTLPEKQRVLYLGTLNGLSINRQMKVTGHCFGIAHCNGLTAITFLCPEKVEIISSDGKILKRIETNRKGQEIFTAPYYIVFCPAGKYLYVSDNRDNTVRKFCTSGELLETYESGDLIRPEGVVVTEDGDVIIASRDNHVLHVISSTCNKLKLVGGEKSKLVNPWAMCLSNDNRLYVSNEEGEHINVYGHNLESPYICDK